MQVDCVRMESAVQRRTDERRKANKKKQEEIDSKKDGRKPNIKGKRILRDILKKNEKKIIYVKTN